MSDDDLKIPGFHGWIFYILDDDHQLVEVPDMMEWAMWSFGENQDKRFIALDEVGNVTVSTIFLGAVSRGLIERGMKFHGFETRVTGDLIDMQRKYATWDDALAGHQEIVNRLREKGD